jgi:MFS family permease
MEASAHDPYAALRHRDYRLFLSCGILANVGSAMQAVAVGWELYERTRSQAALGLAGLTQFLPVLLLSLPAGHVADSVSRKGLFVTAGAGMFLAALGLAALSFLQGPIPLIYLCLFVWGVGRAFGAPARWALLREVVPARDLHNAVTWNSSGWQVASVAGPALGGLVVALAGGRSAAAYLLTAACAASSALLFLPARPQPTARRSEPLSPTSLLAGLRFVWRNELLLAAITLDLFAVLLGGATALLPVYARDILDIGPAGLGWLLAAPALGALVMAVMLAHRPPLRHAGRALVGAVVGFGVATVGFGLSQNAILSFVFLALTGALDNISVVVRGTLVQVLTPDDMRGRVAAVNLVFVSSSNQLGEFESGMTAQWFGTVVSVVAGGIGTIVVVLAVVARWPRLLHLGSLHAPQQVGLAEEPEARAGEEVAAPPP